MMKYIYLMLIFVVSGSKGITQQEYFLRGNKAYKMNNYQQALDNYLMINDKGCCVWGNMGLCYKAQDQKQDALFCWHKALQQASSFKIAYQINNLLLEQETQQSVKPMEKYWLYYIRPFVFGMPLGLMQWLFIMILTMFFISSWYYAARWAFVSMTILGLLVVVIGVLLSMRYAGMTRTYAIIADQTPLYIGPDTSYYKSGQTQCPALVRIIQTKDHWTHITNRSEHHWVENRFLKSLDS